MIIMHKKIMHRQKVDIHTVKQTDPMLFYGILRNAFYYETKKSCIDIFDA